MKRLTKNSSTFLISVAVVGVTLLAGDINGDEDVTGNNLTCLLCYRDNKQPKPVDFNWQNIKILGRITNEAHN